MLTHYVLYMSNDGRIECAEHAPYTGSDSWRVGQYAPISQTEVDALKREGFAVKCEHPRCTVSR